ncbi:hypothetical protein TIFTF001_034268 [Ficus carica]|uniref:Uncharacterized protein n=1 Tax=Ficus carica TaxID=3494 RepID=A0AA88DZK5_FICCA|nr:hypothetical protein TIFTF001_034268 [Ficus carica]
MSCRLATKAGLNGMVHGLSWIGWLPKLLHVKLCVSWFELKWTAAFNHSLAMYHVVLAERKLTSYVYAVGKQPASNL